MQCSQAQHAIQLDLDGELSPLRERALFRHLATCAACRTYSQQHRAIHGVMGQLAGQSRDRKGAEYEVNPSPHRGRHWPRLAALAAVIALCLLGWRFASHYRPHVAHEIIVGNPRPDPRPAPTDRPPSPQLARVEFEPGADVIAIPKPTRNPNVTVLWIYPAIRTAEANPAPAIEPETFEPQGARS